ncbi:efflux RND transporter permease subunit, partial [Klebsiella michiganensis]|uniref:efflux RND transporter permease subunit n=3 Tax=Pseudomonadota TaxID=1224 RepID=UPI0013D17D51
VVTVAIVASALISLTLTPMLCSHMPAIPHDDGKGRKPLTERVFDAVLGGYRWMLDVCLRFRIVVFGIFL